MDENAELVTVTPLPRHVDDRGILAELLRVDDPDAKLGQVYVVESLQAGTVRGLHRHRVLWDWFIIVSGTAKFRFFDDDGAEQVVVASAKNLCRIAVPPGIWHGWSSIEDNTVLISIASEPYMGYGRTGELDEERIPYNYFDGDEDGWSVKPR